MTERDHEERLRPPSDYSMGARLGIAWAEIALYDLMVRTTPASNAPADVRDSANKREGEGLDVEPLAEAYEAGR